MRGRALIDKASFRGPKPSLIEPMCRSVEGWKRIRQMKATTLRAGLRNPNRLTTAFLSQGLGRNVNASHVPNNFPEPSTRQIVG